MVESLKSWLCGAILLVAGLMQPAFGESPSFERAGFAVGLCGDGAAQSRVLDALIRSSGEMTAEDLAFAGILLGGLFERRLVCLGDTAVLLEKAGAPDGREVVSGAVRSANGGRSPVLGLRQRGLVETALASRP